MTEYRFPDGFNWGCATASYQIEGSPLADGAGESIWHRFTHTSGMIMNGDTGDVACDHYRLYKNDVALMKQLGLNAYRFSVAWPRIFPEGRGKTNQAGLDYYSALVDELLAAEIKPCLTLYHWDLPQAIEDVGGWRNPDTALWFGEYARLMFDKLGDRVKFWITLNEPFVVAFIGHALGLHAPGLIDIEQTLIVGHTLLKAHGQAVSAFRGSGQDGRIGITVDLESCMPATDSEKDGAAAERYSAFKNRWFLDPIFFGKYPDEMYEAFSAMPSMEPEDVKIIQQPIDFVGVNNYTRTVWQHSDISFLQADHVLPEGKYTEMEWEVYPDGLRSVLAWVHENYDGPTLYVTENGASFPDTVDPDGSISDDDRVEYLREYIKACHRAIEQGVDLRGYFQWSLMDNFEWGFGYSRRFGIIRVDYDTQRRTIKKSGDWYSNAVKNNGFSD
jgi:beta-glucosidase